MISLNPQEYKTFRLEKTPESLIICTSPLRRNTVIKRAPED